ncbi:MAG: thermopsin family protease, partial [Thermoplasmata archaeon]
MTVSAARAAGVAKARAAFLAAGGNLSDFFPPSINAPAYNPSGTGGHVVPLFDNTPAPMGIATYGLRNTSGKTTPYVLNTKSVEGSFTTSDPLGVEDRAYDGGPAAGVGSQLNVIETNVTLKGSTSNHGNTNQFWLQNTLEYTPGTASGSLSFDENIWNFSYDPQGNQPWAGYSNFPSGTSTILHGGGSVSGGELYEASGPSITVTPAYPITIQTYLNTTVACYPSYTPGCLSTSAAVDEVYMNYSVWNAAGQKVCPSTNSGDKICSTAPGPNTGGTYDNVYFNSANPTGVNPTTAQIQANGYQYASDGNGTNLDMELDFGIGDSDAEVAMGTYADAQLGLFTLNATTGKFQTVPSAYDFGSETGESTEGQYGTWSIGANGAPVEQFRTGPSILAGLWNTSSSPGAYALNYANVNPQNAWVAVAPGVAQTNQEIFRVAPTFGWFNRPTSGGLLGPNMWLQPGIYTVEVMLSGYNSIVQTVDLTSGGYNLNITLTKNPASTTYTPLYAYSNSQLAAISTSGAGTSSNPYILWGNQPAAASLSPLFGDMSQWPFQVWQGIEVNSTTAHATWEPLPSLSITYPWWEVQYLQTAPATGPLPLTNHLPIYLFDVQNVTIADSTNISAEYASAATGGYSILASGVKNVLIAGNHFNVSDEGVDFTGAGGNNTVWGNWFYPLKQSLNPATSGAEPTSTALADADSATATVGNDHIYDNAFYTNSSASTTAGIYWNVSCQAGYSPASFFVGGGIPCQPFGYSQVVNGLTLTGSIVGSSYQGGNFWFNYGNEPNPYANLPFLDRASALSGAARIGSTTHPGNDGDYAPLIAYSVYKESFTETGLPAGTTWNVTVFNSTGSAFLNTTSTTTSTTLVFYFPNGAYTYGISSVISSTTRYAASPASTATGSFSISGANLSPIAITFATAFLANFTETGLATTRRWFINVTGQLSLSSLASTSHLGIGLVNGAYTYTVGTVSGYSTTAYSGGFTVASATVTTPLTWTAVTYGVTFTETGLPAATSWSVTVTPTGGTVTSNSTTHSYSLANGTYKYSVPEASGYAANPATGTFIVSGGTASIGVPFGFAYNASFTETGLPLASAGYEWIITIPGQPVVKSTANPIVIPLPDGTYNFGIGSQSTYSNAGGLNYTGYSPSPASGTLTVNNGPASQAITFSATLWNVPFIETGLPAGTTWEATVYDGAGFISESSNTNTILFTLVNATYAYSIGNVSGYTTSHTGSFLLWGAPNTILVAFNPVYTLTFTESGLPGGTWNVTILHQTLSAPVGSPIVFSFPNGTYSWVIGAFNGYSTSTPSGSTTINGANANVAVTFTRVTYSVTFTDPGLPNGDIWYVNITGQPSLQATSPTTTISTSLSNGTYSFSVATNDKRYAPSYTPSFTVNGGPVSVSVSFTLETYTVSFSETGLLAGDIWYVNISGGPSLSGAAGTVLSTSLANGTYPFSVATNDKRYAPSYTPSFTSSGGASVSVTFSQATYPVTFTETGLLAGDLWYVNITGGPSLSGAAGTTLSTSLVNGTYSFHVATNDKRYAPSYTPSFTSNGGASVSVTFSQATYPVTFKETGLPSGTSWSVTVNAVTHSSVTSTITGFQEANGSYSYSATVNTNMGAASGTFSVNGAPLTVTVPFYKVNF